MVLFDNRLDVAEAVRLGLHDEERLVGFLDASLPSVDRPEALQDVDAGRRFGRDQRVRDFFGLGRAGASDKDHAKTGHSRT